MTPDLCNLLMGDTNMTTENTEYGYAALYQDTVYGLGRTMAKAEKDAARWFSQDGDECPACGFRIRSVTKGEYNAIAQGDVRIFAKPSAR